MKNVLAYQREHPGFEFLQELVLLRENGKMPGTFDRGESLARRVQCIHVGSGETYRGGVVLGALDHEHRYREFAAEKLPIKLVEMRDEALAAYALPVKPVVDIGDRVPGRV